MSRSCDCAHECILCSAFRAGQIAALRGVAIAMSAEVELWRDTADRMRDRGWGDVPQYARRREAFDVRHAAIEALAKLGDVGAVRMVGDE